MLLFWLAMPCSLAWQECVLQLMLLLAQEFNGT
jgi:hypothetical protein